MTPNPKVLCKFVAAAALVFCFVQPGPLAANSANQSYHAEDFIADSGGHQTGPLSFSLELTIRNPTSEPVCFYPEILLLTEVVSAQQPERQLWPFVDASRENHTVRQGGEVYSAVEHRLMGGRTTKYDPSIVLQPGKNYTLKQTRSIKQYVQLYRPTDLGKGLDIHAAADAMYKMKIAGLQIFRCGAIDGKIRQKVAKNILKFHSSAAKKISQSNPDGAYWEFRDILVGDGFRLALPSPPEDTITSYVDSSGG